MSDFVKKINAKFQDFEALGNLSQWIKSLYEVPPAAEWTNVAPKLFSLKISLLQMEKFDL